MDVKSIECGKVVRNKSELTQKWLMFLWTLKDKAINEERESFIDW